MQKHALCCPFFSKHSLRRILVDIVTISVVSLLVFEILPRSATFFTLASVHTTTEQKALHSIIALLCVLFFRMLLMVYKRQWISARILNYLNVIVADMIAGIVYYVITEYAFHSVYPFLLTLSMFMMIDILTLFIRLSYQGVVEDCFVKKTESRAAKTDDPSEKQNRK